MLHRYVLQEVHIMLCEGGKVAEICPSFLPTQVYGHLDSPEETVKRKLYNQPTDNFTSMVRAKRNTTFHWNSTV